MRPTAGAHHELPLRWLLPSGPRQVRSRNSYSVSGARFLFRHAVPASSWPAVRHAIDTAARVARSPSRKRHCNSKRSRCSTRLGSSRRPEPMPRGSDQRSVRLSAVVSDMTMCSNRGGTAAAAAAIAAISSPQKLSLSLSLVAASSRLESLSSLEGPDPAAPLQLSLVYFDLRLNLNPAPALYHLSPSVS